MRFETVTVHEGEAPDFREGGSGDVAVPIHLSSTFARKRVATPTGGYEYSRTGNPTRDALERRLAVLEDARYGLAFSSGMAAETTLLLTLIRSGEHIIAFDDLYGGTRRVFERVFRESFGVDVSYVDATSPGSVQSALQENTRLIWLESPTNPLMKLCDIRMISRIAKDNGAVLIVDNTFMSPYFQNPIRLGADVAVHSTTKYLNGHSDSVGGAVMLSDQDVYGKLKFGQNATGAILSPFDSYLVLRGTKTLAVRMRAHEENAVAVAAHLEDHPRVDRVHYPGLQSHPQHALAKEQMSGFGGMLSFELGGGQREAARFMESLELFALAESLGGVESLIELPAVMTHASIAREDRERIGISDSLIRMSVGIEHIDDLLEDMESAFKKAFA